MALYGIRTVEKEGQPYWRNKFAEDVDNDTGTAVLISVNVLQYSSS